MLRYSVHMLHLCFPHLLLHVNNFHDFGSLNILVFTSLTHIDASQYSGTHGSPMVSKRC